MPQPALPLTKKFNLNKHNREMSAESNGKESGGIVFYEDVENLKKLCNFLRTKHGPPVREALLMDKRVHYLKGESNRWSNEEFREELGVGTKYSCIFAL